jgi:hypothetical protein
VEFIETPTFSRASKDLLDEDAIRALQSFLLQNPEAGDLISGAGGVRKIRWAAHNKGKRSGARIIYYFVQTRATVYLIFAYAKNVKLDLTPTEKRLFAQLAKQLLNETP